VYPTEQVQDARARRGVVIRLGEGARQDSGARCVVLTVDEEASQQGLRALRSGRQRGDDVVDHRHGPFHLSCRSQVIDQLEHSAGPLGISGAGQPHRLLRQGHGGCAGAALPRPPGGRLDLCGDARIGVIDAEGAVADPVLAVGDNGGETRVERPAVGGGDPSVGGRGEQRVCEADPVVFVHDQQAGVPTAVHHRRDRAAEHRR
jgi:hypothetical protein